MQIKYFEDTDSLYIQFNNNRVAETKDLDRDTIMDLDKDGVLVGITIEHAKEKTNIFDLSFQQIRKSA